MSAKHHFILKADRGWAGLPYRLLVVRQAHETPADVVLKLLAYLLFFRERLQLEAPLHDDSIPFIPTLLQLDYSLRAALWVECGECTPAKLDKLAVKVPEAELWVVRRTAAELDPLRAAMARAGLRRHRYRLLGFEDGLIDELAALLQPRNDVFWVRSGFAPPALEFDFNGLWFDASFRVEPF